MSSQCVYCYAFDETVLLCVRDTVQKVLATLRNILSAQVIESESRHSNQKCLIQINFKSTNPSIPTMVSERAQQLGHIYAAVFETQNLMSAIRN